MARPHGQVTGFGSMRPITCPPPPISRPQATCDPSKRTRWISARPAASTPPRTRSTIAFCLSDAPAPLREVLRLNGQSGIGMVVSTTEPGIQVYDGRNAIRPGRGPYEGLAIEAQSWPDAPNHAGFPSIVLEPQDEYRQHTVWRFTRG